MRRGAALLLTIALAACSGSPVIDNKQQSIPSTNNGFPAADRPVASILSPRWSTEEARDRLNEAGQVMDLASIKPDMTVADIGAGEGYYTIRLGARVGKKGRVVAEDIVPDTIQKLAGRVLRERLDNVSVRLGLPADPRLPENSFDRVLMVHMYHEIESPYEFLWRLWPALAPDGQVVVVDANRPTELHGTPPELLKCEFAAVGYRLVSIKPMPSAGGYIAIFQAGAERPEPSAIRACKSGKTAAPATVPSDSKEP
ncbi:methyltransferase domain-containing protein [Sphingomonas sp. R-74633]|uniref:class I SAM-dependent methyltransferase n=1 Tax=Sphingomonas sp. R-74633 TaxID=2751188 RepID=UPI0015D3625C|nr:class I SAM-dependent methyltransferase [Sphingomonas sp. R-74633]NYT41261.1 methyltransferase domain-containing protein [Sphingomonas sp. R-74633]